MRSPLLQVRNELAETATPSLNAGSESYLLMAAIACIVVAVSLVSFLLSRRKNCVSSPRHVWYFPVLSRRNEPKLSAGAGAGIWSFGSGSRFWVRLKVRYKNHNSYWIGSSKWIKSIFFPKKHRNPLLIWKAVQTCSYKAEVGAGAETFWKSAETNSVGSATLVYIGISSSDPPPPSPPQIQFPLSQSDFKRKMNAQARNIRNDASLGPRLMICFILVFVYKTCVLTFHNFHAYGFLSLLIIGWKLNTNHM
jgi:hypothetical protein